MVKVIDKEEQLLSLKNDRTKPTTYGWGVRHIQVACMTLALTTTFVTRLSMGIAILAMTEKHTNTSVQYSYEVYDWNKKTQGVILSSFFWGYVLTMIPSTMLVKYFGAKPVMMFTLVSSAVLSALIPFLASKGGWIAVCIARALMGLTQSCLFPTCHTLLGQWLPAHERTTFSAFTYGGPKIGIILALPLFGVLAATDIGWPSIFYFTSILLFLSAGVWWFYSASTPGQHRLMTAAEKAYIEDGRVVTDLKKSNVPWRAIARNKHFWAIFIANVGCDTFYTFMCVDIPTYMEKALGITLQASATFSSIPYLGMWLTSVLGSALADKLINSNILTKTTCRRLHNSIAFYGVGLGLLLMTFMDKNSKNLAIAVLLLSLSLEGFVMSGFMVNHLDLSPNFGGVTLSITNAVANLGSVAAPIYTGYMLKDDPTDVTRWSIVFWTMSGICFVTNTFYVIFASTKRQSWDDPSYRDDECINGETGEVLEKLANSYNVQIVNRT